MVQGWTRIEMLVALYDRAITTIQFAQFAEQQHDEPLMTSKLLEANRFVLGLHAGLNPENCEIAQNIGRLLNFVMLRLEERKFDEAVHFLQKLKSSFEEIQEEAVALEKSGQIPPLSADPGLNAIA